MKLVKAILRPEKVLSTRDKLQDLGFHGITACKVAGYGEMKKIIKKVHRGRVYNERMDDVERIALELVVSEAKLAEVVDTIMAVCKTTEGGDGRIYTLPLDDSIHIDTGSKHLGGLAEEGKEDV